MLKIGLYIILSLLCMTAQEAWADDSDDAWDEDNYKPYNTDVVLEKTNLPIVFVNTRDVDGNTTAIHKAYRVSVRMKIIDNINGLNYGDTIAYAGQRVDYEGWVGIKYRGSSSFSQSDKKPYGFRTLKTSDVNGEKDKVKLLSVQKMMDKWYVRKILRRDLRQLFHAMQEGRDEYRDEKYLMLFRFTPLTEDEQNVKDDDAS